MRWLLAILLLLASGSAQAQTVRGLFVGIDKYRYAKSDTYPKALFRNLSGAVSDTQTFKALLQDLDKIKVDIAVPGVCTSSNEVSMTLTDDCATRDAILSALNSMVDKSGPKDTLIFYFAGHGAQFEDDENFNQASGYNGTILPTDARKPGAETDGDIFDFELKAIKERAVARGIYFITVFDSCNSGSATRDPSLGEGRNAPILRGKLIDRPQSLPLTGPGGGYWVHLAAAQDGETAFETPTSGAIGARNAGVFTTALAQSMRASPSATFGDLIRDVRARLAASGTAKQTPMAEGELTASLGTGARNAITFEVLQKDGEYTLNAGRLSGITEGSVFAMFATEVAAFAPNAVPLALATITTVGDFSATLAVEQPEARTLPAALVALETRHAYGKTVVTVANRIGNANEKAVVDRAIGAVPFASLKGKASVQLVSDPDNASRALLKTIDGQLIGSLGEIADQSFADKVREGLKKVLRVQQLLKLSQGGNLLFCIDDGSYHYAIGFCPAKEKRDLRVIKVGAETLVTVHNTDTKPRYIYVFGIDPSYGVALILPKTGAVEPPQPESRPFRNEGDPVVPRVPGIYRFVTIATEEPITAAALEQDGISRRSTATCNSMLEEILCAANAGTRSGGTIKAGKWSAIVETVIVE